jgi:hypothetical protein
MRPINGSGRFGVRPSIKEGPDYNAPRPSYYGPYSPKCLEERGPKGALGTSHDALTLKSAPRIALLQHLEPPTLDTAAPGRSDLSCSGCARRRAIFYPSSAPRPRVE